MECITIGAGMSISTQRMEDFLVLAPGRKLSISEGEAELTDLVQAALAEGTTRFVLDLSAVEFIDSQGVGLIVASFVSIRNKGGRLVLCGLQSRAALVLRMANLHMVLDIQEGGPDAVVWG